MERKRAELELQASCKVNGGVFVLTENHPDSPSFSTIHDAKGTALDIFLEDMESLDLALD